MSHLQFTHLVVCLFPDLLRVPASEGEVLQRGADGAFLLGTLQSGWQKHSRERLGLGLLLWNSYGSDKDNERKHISWAW